MGALELVLLTVSGVSILFAVLFFNQSKAKSSERQSVLDQQARLEEKIHALRAENTALKADVQRKSDRLEESLRNFKKKMKLSNQKQEQNDSSSATNDVGDDTVRTLEALRAQMEAQTKELIESHANELNKLRKESAHELREKETALKKLNDECLTLKDKKSGQVSERMRELFEKNELSDEVLSELARLYRKSEQNELMNTLARNKLQLAQERFNEIQRRYFALARELAIAAGKGSEDLNDDSAVHLAERILDASETSDVKAAEPTIH